MEMAHHAFHMNSYNIYIYITYNPSYPNKITSNTPFQMHTFDEEEKTKQDSTKAKKM